MTSGFDHQDLSTDRAFSRSTPRPQQVGVRLPREAQDAPPPAPQRPAERRTF